jgi:Rrf2 family protein
MTREVARRQGVSERYLEQIFLALKNAGLLRSVRGAGGGYMLAKKPSEITLLEVAEAAMGDLSLVECVGDPSACERSAGCAASLVWREMTEAMRKVMAEKTLSELVEMQRNMGGPATMYYI